MNFFTSKRMPFSILCFLCSVLWITVCLVVVVLLSIVWSLFVWLSLFFCPLCGHCLSGCLCSFVHCIVIVCLVVFVLLSIVWSLFVWWYLFLCPLCCLSYFGLRLQIAYPFDIFKLYHNSVSNGFYLISICTSYYCHTCICRFLPGFLAILTWVLGSCYLCF